MWYDLARGIKFCDDFTISPVQELIFSTTFFIENRHAADTFDVADYRASRATRFTSTPHHAPLSTTTDVRYFCAALIFLAPPKPLWGTFHISWKISGKVRKRAGKALLVARSTSTTGVRTSTSRGCAGGVSTCCVSHLRGRRLSTRARESFVLISKGRGLTANEGGYTTRSTWTIRFVCWQSAGTMGSECSWTPIKIRYVFLLAERVYFSFVDGTLG